MGPGPNDRGNSRHHLIAACEASLKRLRTDWIDLYQLHQWDGETPLEETLAALDHSRPLREGPLHRLLELLRLAHHEGARRIGPDGSPRFVSQQIHYTLQAREAEYELVPISIAEGLGILVWSPIAGGLLSGKFRRGKKGPAGARHSPAGRSRRSATRRPSTTLSTCSSMSPTRAASRARGGACMAPRPAGGDLLSSAVGTKSSSRTASPPPIWRTAGRAAPPRQGERARRSLPLLAPSPSPRIAGSTRPIW